MFKICIYHNLDGMNAALNILYSGGVSLATNDNFCCDIGCSCLLRLVAVFNCFIIDHPLGGMSDVRVIDFASKSIHLIDFHLAQSISDARLASSKKLSKLTGCIL